MIEVMTSGLRGIESFPVRITARASERGSEVAIVGAISEASVRETRVRVRAALASSQGGTLVGFPSTIGWTAAVESAHVSQSAGAYDLALAVAVLSTVEPSGGAFCSRARDALFLGELSFDGEVRPIRGILPRLRAAARAGVKRAIVPRDNGAEAALVEGIEVLVARHLGEVRDWLAGGYLTGSAPRLLEASAFAVSDAGASSGSGASADMEDVIGQPAGRLALEVAAAGAHHLLLSGPPGSGKTMLARRLPGILPTWTREEAIAATEIHSAAGLIGAGNGMLASRPFRAPHHTVSDAGLLGGGFVARPGEISLAHEGVLHLDEIPEMKASALEGLVAPLRAGSVRFNSYAHAPPVRFTESSPATATFPAKVLLVGSMNRCPCGLLGQPGRACACTAASVRAYEARLRAVRGFFDLSVTLSYQSVAAVAPRGAGPKDESSAAIRERVTRARAMQAARFASGNASVSLNSRLFSDALDPDDLSALGLRKVLSSLSEGMTSMTSKELCVARTVADLDGADEVTVAHVETAYGLRGAS